MRQHVRLEVKRFQHLFVAFEYLHGVPALLLLRQIVHHGFLDMRQRVFHRTGEGVQRDGLAVICRFYRGFGGFRDSGALKRRYLHHLAADLPRKLRDVYPVALFFHDVHHIYRDYHRDPELGELCRKIKVALQVRAVHDV